LESYYICILYSGSIDKYYTGFSTNPQKRLQQHLNNEKAKFTEKAKDWVLAAVFFVSNNSSEAMKIEKFIKKQKSRRLIQLLCNPSFIPEGQLAQLVRVPHVMD
jgi:putative endonuclease